MQQVPLTDIQVPKGWRSAKKAGVAQMALSFEREGQLQPVGVRPDPDRPGGYLLVWGRHRLEAAKKVGWTTIGARVLDLAALEHAAVNTIAENLVRTPLSAAERVIALKAWNEHYAAEHPETTDRPARAAEGKYGPDGAAPAPRFSDAANEITGIPASTVRRIVAAGSNLTEEQLGALAEHPDVKLEHVKAINRLEPGRRSEAVNLIAAGLSPREAVATATLPPNATREQVGDPGAHQRTEADLPDDEWLETFCGEVLAQLKYQTVFRRDALLYRQIQEARRTFRNASKKALAQSHVQLVGPFYMICARFVNVDHPSRWMKCGVCDGTGIAGGEVKAQCGNCRGAAFAVRTVAGGAR